MVIKRSTSPEVARLIRDVLGDDPVTREAAMARLAVIGPRAVDRLLATLSNNRPPSAQAALLQTLERIGDSRALDAAGRYVTAADEGVALSAVAVLRPLLQTGGNEVATQAIGTLTAVALDASRPDAVRCAALDALHDLSPEIVNPLHDRLRDDPSVVVRRQAGWTGRERPAGRAPVGPDDQLGAYVHGELPDDPELVKTAIGGSGMEASLPVLHRLIVAIRGRERTASSAETSLRWAVVRGLVHQALSERGSRVALYDIRETLEAMPDRVSVGMVAALSAIGDASCLEPLAEARTETADPWLKSQLADAFQRICERERITRRHGVLRRILKKHPDLEKVGAGLQ